MTVTDVMTLVLIVLGSFFFLAGTLGLIRFPDVYTRLHALTKADNVGLGLLIAGLALQAESWTTVGKLILIWLLVLLAGASVAHLIANAAIKNGVNVWKR